MGAGSPAVCCRGGGKGTQLCPFHLRALPGNIREVTQGGAPTAMGQSPASLYGLVACKIIFKKRTSFLNVLCRWSGALMLCEWGCCLLLGWKHPSCLQPRSAAVCLSAGCVLCGLMLAICEHICFQVHPSTPPFFPLQHPTKRIPAMLQEDKG